MLPQQSILRRTSAKNQRNFITVSCVLLDFVYFVRNVEPQASPNGKVNRLMTTMTTRISRGSMLRLLNHAGQSRWIIEQLTQLKKGCCNETNTYILTDIRFTGSQQI